MPPLRRIRGLLRNLWRLGHVETDAEVRAHRSARPACSGGIPARRFSSRSISALRYE
jgi:hypothetical protein